VKPSQPTTETQSNVPVVSQESITWDRIETGQMIDWIIQDSALERIETQALANGTHAMLRQTDEEPPVPAEGAYDYFRIISENMTTSQLTIRFKVQADVAMSSDVALAYYGRDWNDLQSQIYKTEGAYSYYKADAPDIGYFAIRATKHVAAPPVTARVPAQEENVTQEMVEQPIQESPVVEQPAAVKAENRSYLGAFVLIALTVSLVTLAYGVIHRIRNPMSRKGVGGAQATTTSQDGDDPEDDDQEIASEPIADAVHGDARGSTIHLYISKAVRAGMHKKRIRENLIGVGWNHQAVDDALKKHEKRK
jgi:PGF-pre-PGF domain-containing protein